MNNVNGDCLKEFHEKSVYCKYRIYENLLKWQQPDCLQAFCSCLRWWSLF